MERFWGCGSLECLPRKQEARHWLIQAWWGMAGHQKFNVILSYPASIKSTQGWDPEWLKKWHIFIHTHLYIVILFNIKADISGTQSFMWHMCVYLCMYMYKYKFTNHVFSDSHRHGEMLWSVPRDRVLNRPTHLWWLWTTIVLTLTGAILRNSPKCASLGRRDEGKKNKTNLSLYLLFYLYFKLFMHCFSDILRT